MNLPDEIRRLLPPGAAVQAQAGLSCSPASPVGETRLVLAQGQLHAFVRQSLIGGYEPLALDPAFAPRLEGDDFSGVLVIQPAGGEPARLRISPFERADIQRLLAALPAATTPLAAAAEVPPAPVPAAPPVLPPSPPPPPEPAPLDQAPPQPLPADAQQSLPPVRPNNDAQHEESRKDDFAGELPFLTGCLPMLAITAVLIAGCWVFDDYSRAWLAARTGWGALEDGFLEVLGKIVAVVSGLVGGILVAIRIDAWNFRTNRSGRVTIKHGRIVVLAPKSAWKSDLPLDGAEIAWHCRALPRDSEKKEDEQPFAAQIVISSRHDRVALTVDSIAWNKIAHPDWQQVDRLEKPARALKMPALNFGYMQHRLLRELSQLRQSNNP
jgi:hypothetical protein